MNNKRSAILSRMFVIFGILFLIPCAVALQLFRINVVEGAELRELWSEQAIDKISIPARRGNIYDGDGSLLATNSVAYKVALDPKVKGLTRDQIRRLCRTLAKHTSRPASGCLRDIESAPGRSRYVVLDRNASMEAYEEIRKLDIRGVILEEKYQRRYNFGTLAAHLLGFVNHNAQGMIGLEKFYESELSGRDGIQQVRRDRNGRIYSYVGAPRRQPRQGYSLHTTIDSHIQAILEEELKAGIERTGSSYGTAIVLEPGTGAVKAMANYPTFDPNKPASADDENRRNYAISDMIEPGSTFKLITAIAAVEQSVVSLDEKFETPADGKRLINGQWMRDHDPLGTLSFPQVIERSSNIATAEIAMRLKKDTFYQYARNSGFGTPTNIDLPNEETGRLQKPYEWSRVTLPWMAIGYEVQVTPLQLVQAYAAFANNGMMMRPYLVERIVDEEENTVWKHNPARVRQIAKTSTIKKLNPVFRMVVSDSGTARQAGVDGLSIAGKTGTAQKYIDGQYRFAHRASFVGFFPEEKAKYVCLILLDEPETSIYGGMTAGPIFSRTAKRIAGLDHEIEKEIIGNGKRKNVPFRAPDLRGLTVKEAEALLKKQDLAYTLTGSGDHVASQIPDSGSQLSPGDKISLQLGRVLSKSDTSELPEGYAVIPDLAGMSMRKAALLVIGHGFETELIGSGTVYKQFPEAGDMMKRGRTVTIRGKAKSLESLAKTGATE